MFSHSVKSTTQHAMSRKVANVSGMKCFNNRFSLPNLLGICRIHYDTENAAAREKL